MASGLSVTELIERLSRFTPVAFHAIAPTEPPKPQPAPPPDGGPRVRREQLETQEGVARVVPLGDIHLGAYGSYVDAFEDYVHYVLSAPATYALGMGDMAEQATRDSVGDGPYGEILRPREQLRVLREILKPLADSGKLLGLHSGNHERRVQKQADLNMMEELADMLGVPYLGDTCYHFWQVGSEVYTVYTTHGSGASRTAGARLNKLLSLGQVSDAELSLMGHLHTILHTCQPEIKFDREKGTVSLRPRWYAITGSLLGYYRTYAETAGLRPSLPGLIQVTLFADHHWIEIA